MKSLVMWLVENDRNKVYIALVYFGDIAFLRIINKE